MKRQSLGTSRIVPIDDGIEDRHPTHADAFGTGCQPNGKDRGHCGIVRHLGHRTPAESMADGGCTVGEHGEMTWRLAQVRRVSERRIESTDRRCSR